MNRFVLLALFPVVLCLLASPSETSAEERRLTTDGRLKMHPQFVDDGKAVVFTVQETPRLMRLMRLDVEKGTVAPLHPDADKNEFEVSIAPDGSLRAYVQSRGNLSLALVLEDAQGNRTGEVPPAGGFSGMRSPAVSPDAKRVVYAYPEGGRQHLYSCDRTAKDKRQLTDSSGVNNWPHFSPDGTRIAFGSTRDGNYEIYTMRAAGKDVRRLTENRFQDTRPRFSPDGKRIAFTSTRDGNHEVYVVNVDGTGLVRVTKHPERDDYPTWSPTGDRLLIVSERKGRHDLYSVPVPD